MAKQTDIRIIGPSLRPWIDYLDRLSREPSAKTQMALSAVLNAAEVQARANTHVITGRLLASMEKESSVSRTPRRVKWEGRLSLGKGIRYAKYEIGDYRTGVREDWLAHPEHGDPFDNLDYHYAAIDIILDNL